MKSVFWVFLLLLFSLGVACVFFPKVIQSAAVRAVDTGITSRSHALTAFVESSTYLIVVRIVGLIALLAAVFLTFASL